LKESREMTREELSRKKIGVLMGGLSAEREVSLSSGRAVLEALREKGYEVVAVDVGRDPHRAIESAGIEVAFIALHGRWGEDGVIQGLLESMGIPYTGSGVTASALGMDKIRSRWIFERHGLPVPEYAVATNADEAMEAIARRGLGLPLVVKPSKEGSSVGVTIVRREDQLMDAIQGALSFGHPILMERYIAGREIQVGILEDQALGAIEIRPKVEFYDYRAKYTDGLAEHLFPAPIPQDRYREALELSLKAHRLLGCEGGTRVDLRLEDGGGFYLLEVNTLPGMTPLSLLPEIARGVGIEFPDLCERILLGARLKA